MHNVWVRISQATEPRTTPRMAVLYPPPSKDNMAKHSRILAGGGQLEIPWSPIMARRRVPRNT